MEKQTFINEISKDNCDNQIKIEDEVVKALINRNLSIATAESCTGGLLSGKLINYSGISSVFIEGAVTYSNEAKMNRLGVKKETLEKYGAVSEETAYEMASGIAKVSGADVGVSITGIAGPAGGTDEKPVGLVYIGLYIDGNVEVKKYNFTGGRQTIRNKTVEAALELLKKRIEI